MFHQRIAVNLPDLRFLVVDEDHQIRKPVRSMLSPFRGAIVEEAAMAPAAVDCLRHFEPDVRPFVKARTYFGPDRRHRGEIEYEGPERRRDDNLAERHVSRRTMSGRRRCITELQPAR